MVWQAPGHAVDVPANAGELMAGHVLHGWVAPDGILHLHLVKAGES
jgi:hypothetical protein